MLAVIFLHTINSAVVIFSIWITIDFFFFTHNIDLHTEGKKDWKQIKQEVKNGQEMQNMEAVIIFFSHPNNQLLLFSWCSRHLFSPKGQKQVRVMRMRCVECILARKKSNYQLGIVILHFN